MGMWPSSQNLPFLALKKGVKKIADPDMRAMRREKACRRPVQAIEDPLCTIKEGVQNKVNKVPMRLQFL
eukprot:1796644-Rhodomonas_salina.1